MINSAQTPASLDDFGEISEHPIGDCYRVGVHPEAALGDDQVRELLGNVYIRAFQRPAFNGPQNRRSRSVQHPRTGTRRGNCCRRGATRKDFWSYARRLARPPLFSTCDLSNLVDQTSARPPRFQALTPLGVSRLYFTPSSFPRHATDSPTSTRATGWVPPSAPPCIPQLPWCRS
jgi:hypothetical protein